jgi:tRNA nucleotidyltransferase (CCA-adding enzyme)
VGGAVRDLLLGRSSKDLDVAVEGTAGEVAELATRLASRPAWSLQASHAHFGTATLAGPGGFRVDLAATRREKYSRPAALPVVVSGVSIAEDLGRRDFTIHAIARRVAASGSLGPLLDPFGGKDDILRRLVRLLHARSLVDDPTRALRAVRYAVRLGFGVDGSFRVALALTRREGAFRSLSGDRFRRALEEVLGEDDFEKATELLLEFRLLDDASPGWGEGLRREISSKGGERREEDGTPNLVSRWVSLLSSLSPSKRIEVAERLNFSRALRRAAGVPRR